MNAVVRLARFGLLGFVSLSLGLTTSPPAAADAVPVAFSHGVAVGDVTHTSAVFWTRVDQQADLTLEVARDPAFGPPVKTATAAAAAARDFTVKVVLGNLTPEETHYYRFRSGPSSSAVGTFKTAPAPGHGPGFRFAWTGDTDGTKVDGAPFFNDFDVLDAAREEGLDFFVYLGDTIYADSPLRGAAGPASTLQEYRDAYKVNLGYPKLRDLMKATAFISLWDDHEFRDDFVGPSDNPTLYTNGRQAFLEYSPVATSDLPRDPTCAGDPLFREFSYGKMADVIVPDERSCRSPEVDAISPASPHFTGVCQGDLAPTLPASVRSGLPAFFPNPPSAACLAALHDPARTLLGPRQKALLKNALAKSKAKFKFILNEVSIQQQYINPYDRWEGYAAERREILEFIRDQHISNVIFLTTDSHLNLINEVFVDRFAAPTPMAWEFVTGPVATFTDKQSILRRFGPTAGPLAVNAKQQIYSLLGADCRNLDTYSYGLVDLDSRAGTATLTLKNSSGATIKDDLNAAISCAKTLGP